MSNFFLATPQWVRKKKKLSYVIGVTLSMVEGRILKEPSMKNFYLHHEIYIYITYISINAEKKKRYAQYINATFGNNYLYNVWATTKR